MTEQQGINRKRCLSCPYYGMNRCPLMLDGDVFNLDICVLEIVNKKEYPSDGPEMFMFQSAPQTFLSYLTFMRRNILPEVGTKVLTLHAGFSGYAGVIRTVTEIKEIGANNDKVIIVKSPKGEKSLSYCNEWYKDFFALDKNN